MDIRLELDPALSEPQVVVRAPAMTPEVEDLLARLEGPETLLGFREGGGGAPSDRGYPPLLRGGQGGAGPDGARHLHRAPTAL